MELESIKSSLLFSLLLLILLALLLLFCVFIVSFLLGIYSVNLIFPSFSVKSLKTKINKEIKK
jgi:hypothetical protein